MVKGTITKGDLKRDKATSFAPSRYKKNFNTNHTQPTKSVEVNSITVKANFQLNIRREFSNLRMTLTQALRKLVKANLIQPLPVKPSPKELGPYYNPNEHYEYHLGLGHNTDGCVTLKHATEGLIDSRKLKVTLAKACPN